MNLREQNNSAMADKCVAHTTIHLALERTFLAWIRTSLAFIAGGIALNALSFDIDPGIKHWLSIVALSLGAVIAAWAWFSWLRVELAMRTKTPLPHSPALIVLTSALLAVAVVAAIAFI